MPDLTERLAAAFADRYRIERELGAGGMATVYLATDLKLDRQVALKVLRPELTPLIGTERFLAEIRITARLDHPHILTLFDSGTAGEFLYYVLPYVKGDSLRHRLDREGQLSVTEALAITGQVAGAVDYAHGQGVIHRDIKPENIMLREGEAMLMDFGIALAVREAGGERLTGTGLSLGTPQYMSPEQATANQRLDGRTDVYSLGAVCYEMLAGEPPVTGPTAQAIIARLLTQSPTPLRVIRDGVPEGVSRAVAIALARTPADRFSTAGEFVAAAEAGRDAQPPRRRTVRFVAIGAIVVAVAALTLLALTGRLKPRQRSVVLGNRTQLTGSANVLLPAISADGKQLAYFTEHCTDRGCTYAVEVQDIGGTTTRTVLEGATAEYWLEWSPDRRNLLVYCTMDKRSGTWLVSVLGGVPRFVGARVATFAGGGDSLLVGPGLGVNSAPWIQETTLGGDIRDSIPIPGPGTEVGRVLVVPGTRWIIVEVKQGELGRWEVLDRDGAVAGRLTSSFRILAGREAGSALWLDGAGKSVVRVPIDPRSGRFAAHWDTLPGPLDDFSVTADGRNLVADAGTADYGVWRLAFADLLAGRLPDSQRIARASTPLQIEISPDGRRLRWIREQARAADGLPEEHIDVTPYAGTVATTIPIPGALIGAYWIDSVTLGVGTRRPDRHVHLGLVDVRSGLETRGADLPVGTDITDFTWVANGWSWISASGDSVVVRQGNRTRTFAKPPGLLAFGQILSDRGGHFISFLGWASVGTASLEVGMISLDDDTMTRWSSVFAENGGTAFLSDGSVLFVVFETAQTVTLFRLRGPGQMERLGTIPLSVTDISIAGDLKHAVVTVRAYHADAWMSRIAQR